jgi:signal transduction histidine kinase
VPVSLYAGLLRRRLSDDPGSLDVLARVEGGLTALDAMVNDMLNFTADREPNLSSVRLRDVVDGVLDGIRPQLEAQDIRTSVDVSSATLVSADRESLRRAVLNLVLNAVDAQPHGGEIVVTGVVARDSVELEVADAGPGLSGEANRRAFEPFFTTKSNGIGLGLAIVYRLIEAHGGAVTAQNCPEGGAAFTIRLPRRKSMEAAA